MSEGEGLQRNLAGQWRIDWSSVRAISADFLELNSDV
jgi:hypothetical protein